MSLNYRSLPTYTEAVAAADLHRANNGDDVVRHDPEDYGTYLACEDCAWALGYIEQQGIDDELPCPHPWGPCEVCND